MEPGAAPSGFYPSLPTFASQAFAIGQDDVFLYVAVYSTSSLCVIYRVRKDLLIIHDIFETKYPARGIYIRWLEVDGRYIYLHEQSKVLVIDKLDGSIVKELSAYGAAMDSGYIYASSGGMLNVIEKGIWNTVATVSTEGINAMFIDVSNTHIAMGGYSVAGTLNKSNLQGGVTFMEGGHYSASDILLTESSVFIAHTEKNGTCLSVFDAETGTIKTGPEKFKGHPGVLGRDAQYTFYFHSYGQSAGSILDKASGASLGTLPGTGNVKSAVSDARGVYTVGGSYSYNTSKLGYAKKVY